MPSELESRNTEQQDLSAGEKLENSYANILSELDATISYHLEAHKNDPEEKMWAQVDANTVGALPVNVVNGSLTENEARDVIAQYNMKTGRQVSYDSLIVKALSFEAQQDAMNADFNAYLNRYKTPVLVGQVMLDRIITSGEMGIITHDQEVNLRKRLDRLVEHEQMKRQPQNFEGLDPNDGS